MVNSVHIGDHYGEKNMVVSYAVNASPELK